MVCVGIALIFWLLVKLSQPYNSTETYPLDYTLPSGKTFVSPPPQEVIATLRGRGWDLISNNLYQQKNPIVLELAELPSQAINSTTMIDKIQKTVPSSISITEVNTPFIFIQIENQSEKTVPIKLEANLQYAANIQLMDSLEMQPDSVTITGPLSEVEAITEWPTESLKKSKIAESQTISVPLVAPKNAQLRLSQPQIQLGIKVEEFTEKSIFVPVKVLNAPDSLQVFPRQIKVRCITGLSHFNDINSNSFSIVADLKGIAMDAEKTTVPVEVVKHPPYVRGIQYQPRSVEFRFVETETEPDTTTLQ